MWINSSIFKMQIYNIKNMPCYVGEDSFPQYIWFLIGVILGLFDLLCFPTLCVKMIICDKFYLKMVKNSTFKSY